MTTADAPDASDLSIDPKLAVELYQRMVRVRRSDERIRNGMAGGEFGFGYWPVEGQEAISAGATAALGPNDQMVTTYRGLGDAVAKGVSLAPYFAELLGKSGGLSKGKAGAMGVSEPEVGLAWATGIVGEGPPIANGLALAQKLRGTDGVVLVSFGDGATSIGFVHEAMNMAGVWDLPVIFLCQNNAYAECTPIADYTRTRRFSDRAAGYGMPGVTVDGTDPVAVYEAVKDAAERARRGEGPTLVEAVAFRLQGHYFGDAMAYVDKEKLAAARGADPVARFRARLLTSAEVDESALEDIEQAALQEVNDAMQFAIDSEEAGPEELFLDVYAQPLAPASRPHDTSAEEVGGPAGATETLGVADAITRTLDRALSRDEAVVLLGEDISDPAGGIFHMTAGLSTKHGIERVRSTPIAESAIMGAALGLSMSGFKAVPEIMFMDFLGVCLDQLANHVAKIRFMTAGRQTAPLTVRVAVGTGGGAQHSQSLEAWLMHVPGLKVVFPGDPVDAAGLLNSCIDDPDPTVFIEARAICVPSFTAEVPVEDYYVPLGKAAIKRPGTDATIVAYGPAVREALVAAESLVEEGVEVEVIDLRTLVPMDLPTVLESVGRTKRLVVTHYSTEFCGPGAEISASVHSALFGQLAAPVERVAATFTPVPFAASLEAHALPSAVKMAAAVRKTLQTSG